MSREVQSQSQSGAQMQGPGSKYLSGPPNLTGPRQSQPPGQVISLSQNSPVKQTGSQTQGTSGNQAAVNQIGATGNNNNNNNGNNINNNSNDKQNTVVNAIPGSGLQQSVSNNNMFNPGGGNTALQAPPGTGNAQFNNNMGSRDNMLNNFGGTGQ
ncbi:putative uncharacterized protein DDB_G0286901 [Aplysia californica]|uniref:Uncharacterized protein n=1 Tax=Aplysia californica TaxID=6500 RepID=A0ABM1A031_APLCA|nr:putative uncharacterized protein DDB_G0286901 [Aplysia californica]